MRTLKHLLTNAWGVLEAIGIFLQLLWLSIFDPEALDDDGRERPSGPGR